MSRTCAIVQFEAVHEEVIPSLVHALNHIGIRPTLYINKKCCDVRGDIFSYIDGIDCDVNYVPIVERQDWENLLVKVKSANHSFAVFSTYQRDTVEKWAAALGLPTVGVVHNNHVFLDSEACSGAFKSKLVKVLCLAPHVAAYLHQRMPKNLIDAVGVVQSLYWGEAAAQPRERIPGRRVVAIPGGVSFDSRDYKKLVSALADPAQQSDALRRLQFLVLGGGSDRAALEEMVTSQGLSDQFQFAPLGPNRRVLYDEYIAGLQRSDLLLPLNPMRFSPYRDHKITSAVPTAAGFALPLVLDRWTQRVYRMPGFETDAHLAPCLSAMAAITDEALSAKQAEMEQTRRAILAQNIEEMDRIVASLRRRPRA